MGNLTPWQQQIETRLAALEARSGGSRAQPRAPAVAGPPMKVDLDSADGNPIVRRDPPRWRGASFQGRPYSECPADYLEAVASFLDWQGDRDEAEGAMTGGNKPRAPFKRLDAARARGWAERNRSIETAIHVPQVPLPDFEDDDGMF